MGAERGGGRLSGEPWRVREGGRPRGEPARRVRTNAGCCGENKFRERCGSSSRAMRAQGMRRSHLDNVLSRQ